MDDFITVDLDSTLYDTSHRHHLIDRENGTDWHAYAEACVEDGVMEGVRQMIWVTQRAGVKVHVVTGRPETSRAATERQLKRSEIEVDGLWMDSSPDHFVEYGGHAPFKVAMVRAVIEHTGGNHLFHVDDYGTVAVALAEEGIACICVRAPHELAAEVDPK